jgi:hypothetical protein
VSGSVRRLTLNGRSRIPTVLEWASANNFVLLSCAAIGSLISLLWVLLQRLEIIRS